jgi:hypothetical protein
LSPQVLPPGEQTAKATIVTKIVLHVFMKHPGFTAGLFEKAAVAVVSLLGDGLSISLEEKRGQVDFLG